MVASIALCVVAFRIGLSLRRARLARRPPPRAARARHLRVARPAVLLVVVGFVAGPVSAAWLRDWTPFASFHGVVGTLAALAFVAAGLQGRRLEAGAADARNAHAIFGGLALALALLAAIAGFVLLP